VPAAVELQELIPMQSDPDNLRRLLSTWAAVYLDKQRTPAHQDKALAAILKAYWNNRTGGAAAEFLGVAPLKVLIDAYRNGPQREEVAAVLFRIIRQEVVAVSRGRMQSDEVDEAVSFMLAPREDKAPIICSYEPDRKSLRNWLRTVLRNWRTDQLRKKAPRPGLVEDIVLDLQPLIAEALIQAEELWRCVVGIKPLIRLPGLVWTGWWELLSEDMKQACLEAYNSKSGGQPLPLSFADDVRKKCSTREQLRPALAKAFGCSLLQFSGRVHRFLKEVQQRLPPPDYLWE
jgi:hypothetical protein